MMNSPAKPKSTLKIEKLDDLSGEEDLGGLESATGWNFLSSVPALA